MDKLIRFIAIVLLSPLIYAFVYEAYLAVMANYDPISLRHFIFGFITYLFIYLILAGRRMQFFEVFEHELGHTLAGLAFSKNIEAFAASPVAGFVISDGMNAIVRLAPYFLPVFAIPLLIVRPFVSPPAAEVINFLIGLTLAFHYVSLIRWEFRPKQPDLEDMGWWFSIGVTLLMNAIVLIVILSVVLENYSMLVEYLQNTWTTTSRAYQIVLTTLELNDITYSVTTSIGKWVLTE